MRFRNLIIFFILGTVCYDLFGEYEHTNWSIFANSINDIFVIGCLIINARSRLKSLYYGLASVLFIEWLMLIYCVGMPFEKYENITAYSCYFDYGTGIIIVYFLFDYGIHNKNSFKQFFQNVRIPFCR